MTGFSRPKSNGGLLIENGTVLTMDARSTVHSPGWVWVEGDRVQAGGPGSPPTSLVRRAQRTIDATHMAVLPGLVNAHTHLSQTFMRGVGDDMSLLDWLNHAVWPIQAEMTPDDMRLAALLGLVENVRCGATAVVQHHKILTTPRHVDAAAEAAAAVGLRMLLARSWVDVGPAAESYDNTVAEMGRLRDRWHGAADGRISIGFGPLAPWRCSEDTMRRTLALSREWGLPTHIHVAESRDEIEMVHRRTGLGHIDWLDSLGALGPDLHLVHCIWIDEREMDRVAQSGCLVVHCPVSNMYLASGVAPLRDMLKRSIPIAIGTDGPSSHNCQDLLETLKVAVLLAKVTTGDPTVLATMTALRMVTAVGGQVFGREDLGHIAPGAKADIVIVDLDNARCAPVHRPESALLYSAVGPDVRFTIVDGQILLDDGRVAVLDEESLRTECRGAARDLLSRAGVPTT